MVNHPVLSQDRDFALQRLKQLVNQMYHQTKRQLMTQMLRYQNGIQIIHIPFSRAPEPLKFSYPSLFCSSSPVPARFLLEQAVEFAHLAGSDGETGQVGVGHADPLDQAKEGAFGVLPDHDGGGPIHYNKVWGLVEELAGVAGYPEHAGMGHHTQRAAIAHVRLKARGGCIVHTNHTLRLVDLISSTSAQDVAGAGNQCTLVTMQVHGLSKGRIHTKQAFSLSFQSVSPA